MRKNKLALAITIPLSLALLTGCSGNTPVAPTAGVEQPTETGTPVDPNSAFIITPEVYSEISTGENKIEKPEQLPLDARESLSVSEYAIYPKIGDKLPAQGETFHIFKLQKTNISGEGTTNEVIPELKINGNKIKTPEGLNLANNEILVAVSASKESSIILEVTTSNGSKLGSIDLKTGAAEKGINSFDNSKMIVDGNKLGKISFEGKAGEMEIAISDFKIQPEHNGMRASNNGEWVIFRADHAKIDIPGLRVDTKESYPTFSIVTVDGKKFEKNNGDGKNIAIEIDANDIDLNKAKLIVTLEGEIGEAGSGDDPKHIEKSIEIELKK